ncbi:DEAD/DEAH box helicase [bacterium]|nr:DEAD/DEAH box helicase [bacterium]MBU1985277.1 DEAD/DEAH box helicase [bacterium]
MPTKAETTTTTITAPGFQNFGLDERLLRAVAEEGYERPTPIQDLAIPLVMAGRDMMGSAQTGTGKTAAFGLPILHRLLGEHKRGHALRTLILSPTRELAAQIEESLKNYARHTKLRIAAVIGGVNIKPQTKALREGVDILVATPGRLLDHVGQKNVTFHDVEVFVLDEGDRMLDMGFLPDIRRIIALLPRKRQTLLFSATIPPEIATLAGTMLSNPEHVQVGVRSAPAVGITHAVYPVPSHLKPTLLPAILREIGARSVLVFTRTKRRADRLSRVLARSGLRIGVLHGDRTQAQRIAALDGFKRGKFDVLIATDIAARGLDIEGITHVINFDVPATPEDYVHRIGRTARAEAVGDAFTLVSPEEDYTMRQIEAHLGQVLPRVALRDFDYEVTAPEKKTGLQKASVNVRTIPTSFRSSRKRKLPRKR